MSDGEEYVSLSRAGSTSSTPFISPAAEHLRGAAASPPGSPLSLDGSSAGPAPAPAFGTPPPRRGPVGAAPAPARTASTTLPPHVAAGGDVAVIGPGTGGGVARKTVSSRTQFFYFLRGARALSSSERGRARVFSQPLALLLTSPPFPFSPP